MIRFKIHIIIIALLLAPAALQAQPAIKKGTAIRKDTAGSEVCGVALFDPATVYAVPGTAAASGRVISMNAAGSFAAGEKARMVFRQTGIIPCTEKKHNIPVSDNILVKTRSVLCSGNSGTVATGAVLFFDMLRNTGCLFAISLPGSAPSAPAQKQEISSASAGCSALPTGRKQKYTSEKQKTVLLQRCSARHIQAETGRPTAIGTGYCCRHCQYAIAGRLAARPPC